MAAQPMFTAVPPTGTLRDPLGSREPRETVIGYASVNRKRKTVAGVLGYWEHRLEQDAPVTTDINLPLTTRDGQDERTKTFMNQHPFAISGFGVFAFPRGVFAGFATRLRTAISLQPSKWDLIFLRELLAPPLLRDY